MLGGPSAWDGKPQPAFSRAEHELSSLDGASGDGVLNVGDVPPLQHSALHPPSTLPGSP